MVKYFEFLVSSIFLAQYVLHRSQQKRFRIFTIFSKIFYGIFKFLRYPIAHAHARNSHRSQESGSAATTDEIPALAPSSARQAFPKHHTQPRSRYQHMAQENPTR